METAAPRGFPSDSGGNEDADGFEARLCFWAGASMNAIGRARITAASTRARLSETLIAEGALDPAAYCQALARECNFNFCDGHIPKLAPDAATREPWRLLRGRPVLPLLRQREKAAICAEQFPPAALKYISGSLGPARSRITLVNRATLTEALTRTQSKFFLREAIYSLTRRRPNDSAQGNVWMWQILALAAFVGVFVGAGPVAPRETMLLGCGMFTLTFFLAIMVRFGAAMHTFRSGAGAWCGHRAPPLPDCALPRYSVLVPLYKETRVLPSLVAALKKLDYPAALLDTKIVLEESDRETIAAARAMTLPGNISLVIVPDSEPRTKPKALNYALQFATGDFVVIYDAEDQPEPDQLRKAAAVFAASPPDVVCLQARLSYFNPNENWLARQFTIEYDSLFRGVLPTLDARGLPLPLGGTSNHFRIGVLRDLGAWDAFNVTEDADLGLRLYRAGWRCRVLDSTTYEEACCQPMNWLRQRSRWIKGWMQTYSVHMRKPRQLLRDLGWRGFFSFQGQFVAVVVSPLAHPLFYVLLAAEWMHGVAFGKPDSLLGIQFWAMSVFNFTGGYAAALMLGLATLNQRQTRRLIPQLVFVPVYWLCISAAAYRALWRLVVAPSHWDKTEHGVSRVAAPSA
jgi:glycosyltransferase XagB